MNVRLDAEGFQYPGVLNLTRWMPIATPSLVHCPTPGAVGAANAVRGAVPSVGRKRFACYFNAISVQHLAQLLDAELSFRDGMQLTASSLIWLSFPQATCTAIMASQMQIG